MQGDSGDSGGHLIGVHGQSRIDGRPLGEKVVCPVLSHLLSIRNSSRAIEILVGMYLASKIPAGDDAAQRSVAAVGLDELEAVYGFIYSRVGNPADAEDLTQQVALKALPRLREGTPAPAVRAYLYATARSVLATFWSGRARLPEAE